MDFWSPKKDRYSIFHDRQGTFCDGSTLVVTPTDSSMMVVADRTHARLSAQAKKNPWRIVSRTDVDADSPASLDTFGFSTFFR
jgi:hypothetical protein